MEGHSLGIFNGLKDEDRIVNQRGIHERGKNDRLQEFAFAVKADEKAGGRTGGGVKEVDRRSFPYRLAKDFSAGFFWAAGGFSGSKDRCGRGQVDSRTRIRSSSSWTSGGLHGGRWSNPSGSG